MRKITLSVLMLSAVFVFAQTAADAKKENTKSKNSWVVTSPSRFEIGAEAGPSVVFLYGNQILRNYDKPECGYSAAAFFQYNFRKVISIRTDLAFERKGIMNKTDLVGVSPNGNYTGTFSSTERNNFDYLTVPILVRATFGDKVKIFINAGPYLGALLREEVITRIQNGEAAGFPAKVEANNTDRYQRVDIGITTGIGFQVPIKKGFSVSFEARNNTGLFNITTLPVINNGTIKTNSTNFLLGFSYALGRRNS